MFHAAGRSPHTGDTPNTTAIRILGKELRENTHNLLFSFFAVLDYAQRTSHLFLTTMKRLSLIQVFYLLTAMLAHTQTVNNFTNNVSSFWNNGQNWSLGTVPNSGNNVEIAGIVPIFATAYTAVINNHSASAASLSLGNNSGGRGILYIQNNGSLAISGPATIGRFNHGTLYLSTGGDMTVQGGLFMSVFNDGGLIDVDGPGTTLSPFFITMEHPGNASITVSNAGLVDTSEILMGNNDGTPKTFSVTLIGSGSSRGVVATRRFYDRSDGTDNVSVVFNGGEWQSKTPAQANDDIFLGMQPGKVTAGAGGMFLNTMGMDRQTAQGLSGGGSITKLGLGTLTLTGDSQALTGSTIVSQGTLMLNRATGRPAGSGPLSVAAAGTLAGIGTVHGTAQISGGLQPGTNGIGQLNFSSGLTLQNGSATRIEITSATVHDRANVTGTLSYGGNLDLVFAGGYVPTNGQQFQLFTAGAHSGAFQTITHSLANRAATMNYATGVLTITAILPNLTITRSGNNVILAWPLSATGWSLVKSATLATSTWVPVTEPDIPNATHHQVTVNTASQQRMFFRLQME
jgi:autotransporter-associated beta strand protein